MRVSQQDLVSSNAVIQDLHSDNIPTQTVTTSTAWNMSPKIASFLFTIVDDIV